MKTTIKGYVLWVNDSWMKEPHFELWPSDVSRCSPNKAFIKEQDFEVEIPDDFDPVPGQIDALREKQTELRAEMQVKLNNLEEQIQRLLCIEYKPTDDERGDK
jgi:hypothetical protein